MGFQSTVHSIGWYGVPSKTSLLALTLFFSFVILWNCGGVRLFHSNRHIDDIFEFGARRGRFRRWRRPAVWYISVDEKSQQVRNDALFSYIINSNAISLKKFFKVLQQFVLQCGTFSLTVETRVLALYYDKIRSKRFGHTSVGISVFHLFRLFPSNRLLEVMKLSVV